MRKNILTAFVCALLFAGGTLAASTTTEFHEWSVDTTETHTYSDVVTVSSRGKSQIFTVEGTLTDQDLYSGTITDEDEVPDPVTTTGETTPPPPDNQPIAAFTYAPSSPVGGSPVSFDGSSSTCADTPCAYVWEDDGPDGAGGTQWPLGTGQTLSFTFQNCPCAIHARLTVTDADGDTATVVQTIQVAAPAPAPPPDPEPDPTPPPTVGDLYLSPSGSDTANCSSAFPCRSFARAADVAVSGQTIIVGTGTYPAQIFAGHPRGSQGNISKTLTFVGQPGNKIRTLNFGSGNFTFDGLDVDAGNAVGPATAPLENGGAPFTFKNGRVGNVTAKTGAILDGAGIVLDNVDFHDVPQGGGSAHVECIQAYAVPNFTLKNSTFTNCGIMGLSLGYPGWWSPKPPAYTGVVIEGNTFNAPVPSNNYALAIWSNKDSCNDTCGWGVMTDYRIRNNYIWSLINRMTEDATTVTCGNTGPGAPEGWKETCG